ncbi:hypothetical protein [Methanopyrus kandleri]
MLPECVPLIPTDEFYEKAKSYVERRASDLGLSIPEDGFYDEEYGPFYHLSNHAGELWDGELSEPWTAIVLALAEFFGGEPEPEKAASGLGEIIWELTGDWEDVREEVRQESELRLDDYLLWALGVFEAATRRAKDLVLGKPSLEAALDFKTAGAAFLYQNISKDAARNISSSTGLEIPEPPVDEISFTFAIISRSGSVISTLCVVAHAMVHRGIDEDQLLKHNYMKGLCKPWVE